MLTGAAKLLCPTATRAGPGGELTCASMCAHMLSHVIDDYDVGVAELGQHRVHVSAEGRGAAEHNEDVVAGGSVEVLGHHLLVQQAQAQVVALLRCLIHHIEGLTIHREAVRDHPKRSRQYRLAHMSHYDDIYHPPESFF